MTEENASKLGKAILHWLEFQVVCKRDWMLSEKSLAQPMGECLHSFHNGKIETELPHPNLDRKLQGRGRQIDYALKNKKGKTIAVIESKWASSTPDLQGIVNDVMRLECVRNTICYFVLAGMRKNIEEKPAPSGIGSHTKKIRQIDSILPFDESNDKNIRIEECNETMRRLFKKFSKDYDFREIPKSLNVKRVFSSVGTHKDETVYVYIWRIKSSKNRALFDPQKTWPKIELINMEIE